MKITGKERRKIIAFCCCMVLILGLMTACGSIRQ